MIQRDYVEKKNPGAITIRTLTPDQLDEAAYNGSSKRLETHGTGRKCKRCGCKLSRYNRKATCWPCQGAME